MARCCLLLLVLLPLLSASAGDTKGDTKGGTKGGTKGDTKGDADQFPCSQEFTREAALYSQARATAHTWCLAGIVAEILISAVSD